MGQWRLISNAYFTAILGPFKNVSDFMKKTCVKEGDRMGICTTVHCGLKAFDQTLELKTLGVIS